METTSEPSKRASLMLPDPCTNNSRTRKGHKKSRGGCFNCKRRKIKARRGSSAVSHVADIIQCQENHPSCHNCFRINVLCTYPPSHTSNSMQVPCSSSLETRTLQSTPTIFNASDMRLFHHFIIYAYPHLPLGNESVWPRDIASFSHSVSLILVSFNGKPLTRS
jgi:hypothetical protein